MRINRFPSYYLIKVLYDWELYRLFVSFFQFVPLGNFNPAIGESWTRAPVAHQYPAGMLKFFYFPFNLCPMTTRPNCQFSSWGDQHPQIWGLNRTRLQCVSKMSNICPDVHKNYALNDCVNQMVLGQELPFGMIFLVHTFRKDIIWHVTA